MKKGGTHDAAPQKCLILITGDHRRRNLGPQAWPSVSNMVEANASRASLPAQTTNWKA